MFCASADTVYSQCNKLIANIRLLRKIAQLRRYETFKAVNLDLFTFLRELNATKAQDSVPRFEHLDEDIDIGLDPLRDLIHAADSKNTKNSVKFAVNVFEEYLHVHEIA